jgi:uncharacterized membrane protein
MRFSTDLGSPRPGRGKSCKRICGGATGTSHQLTRIDLDKVLPQIKVPGTVIQTSLSNEDEQALQQALDSARD